MLDAGFDDVGWDIDKVQRSSVPKLALLWIPIRIFGALAWRREKVRFKTLDAANEPLVRGMNDNRMLLGRTLLCWGRVPA
jgi:hypothetical protein